MATSSIENVRLGVCSLTYKGVDLGYTKGGVEVTVESETHEVTIDQFGNTPVNDYVMGAKITVKVPLAETTVQNMATIMPGGKLVIDETDTDKIRADISSGVGLNLIDIAGVLTLHPIGRADSDISEDFTVWKAATAGGLSFGYKVDEERVFDCEFKGYPADDKRLFSYGDVTATAA
jgi:hypothetical protein